MKKLMSVIILLAFLGSTIVMTGCLGGSDGIGAVLGVAVFILAISASGPAGPAVFAANNRSNLRPAISLNAENITFRVTPLDANGVPVTASAKTIAKADISGATTWTANIELPTADGYNQYLVEVLAGTNPILKSIRYIHSSQKNGAQIAASVNSTSTAEALTYEKWRQNAATAGASSYTFADFKTNLATADQTNINALKSNVEAELNANTTNADLSNVAGTDAAALSVSTNVPGQVIVVRSWDTTSPRVFRNHDIDFENQEWIPANETNIGVSFIAYQMGANYSYRLANYYHFFPHNNVTDDTEVVAYAGNGIDLDQANTVPSVWHTNSWKAKQADMEVGDVYYFRVEKEANTFIYGAIKIE